MKLSDLFPYISESCTVIVWRNGKQTARYDGKDSIPEELNNALVAEGGINTQHNKLHICLV